MKYCTKCILPDTRPGLTFNPSGVCSGCVGHQRKEQEIDWAKRARTFENLVASTISQNRPYDCIVPVSGGKDSWYQVIKAKSYGLNVLAVTWKTHGRTKIGRKNLETLIEKLNVDHIEYTISPDAERKFTRVAFEKTGVSGLPMHMAIFTIPLRLAAQMRIPLVIWGENPQLEYGGNEAEQMKTTLDQEWLSKHGCMLETSAESWIGEEGLTYHDLAGYRLPEVNADFQPNSIFLGSFFRWDSFENAKISESYGFEHSEEHGKTGAWTFADIDCNFISIHHFLKWYKFGMSRAFDNLSVQIRYGLITRNEAIQRLEVLGPQVPKNDIAAFCSFLRKDIRWFWDVCEKHRNTNVWTRTDDGWTINNFLVSDFDWHEVSRNANKAQ